MSNVGGVFVRRKFFLILMSLFLLVPQSVLAASAPADQRSVKKAEVTAVRWGVHHDDDLDNDRLRLVLDMSSPVSVSAKPSNTPTPRLVVNIKGALPGAINKSIDFDGSIINKITFAASGPDTTMVIELPEAVSSGDYRVFTLKEDAAANKPPRIVVDINKAAPQVDFNFKPGLRGKVIGIDPGHGGSDAGAIGLNGTTEKAVNLAVSLQVKALLEKAGAKVIMTRTDDRDVFGRNASDVDELQARTSVANDNKVDIFVSIHSNAIANRDIGGTATYYFPKSKYDSLLSQSIQDSIAPAVNLDDRGSISARFYVLRRSTMPAALVEMAFISNPKEESLLNSPSFQQQMAQGIVKGIDNFFAQASK